MLHDKSKCQVMSDTWCTYAVSEQSSAHQSQSWAQGEEHTRASSSQTLCLTVFMTVSDHGAAPSAARLAPCSIPRPRHCQSLALQLKSKNFTCKTQEIVGYHIPRCCQYRHILLAARETLFSFELCFLAHPNSDTVTTLTSSWTLLVQAEAQTPDLSLAGRG